MKFTELDGKTWSMYILPILLRIIYIMESKNENTRSIILPENFEFCLKRYHTEIQVRVGVFISPWKIKFINGNIQIHK
jgi:hypothetical protein